MIKGIDISAWQSKIPTFDGEFIIIRAGYAEIMDKKFEEHYKNAQKLGKKVGVYWFSYAIDIEGAKKEARKCLEVIKNHDVSMGVWFDTEDTNRFSGSNSGKFTKTNISNMCNAFCEIVEKAGYYAGIYASYSWLKNYINCPKYDKWCAHWFNNDGKIPTGKETEIKATGASIWQYTSKLNGGSQDGDVLLHNDINMYNIQPKQGSSNVKAEILQLIDKLKDKVNEL